MGKGHLLTGGLDARPPGMTWTGWFSPCLGFSCLEEDPGCFRLPQGHVPHPGLGTAKPCSSLPGMPAEWWEEGSPRLAASLPPPSP